MDSEAVRRYLNLLVSWWWVLILSIVVPAGISYYLSSQKPDLYQARAAIIVGASVFQDTNPDRREIDLSNTLAAAYAELLRRRAVLEPVVQRLGLERTPESLASQIGTNIRSGAQLLEITVTDTDPQAAALIANALADELIRRSPTSEENTPEQERFLEDQLKETEDNIKAVEGKIDELTASLAELTSAAEIQEAQEKIEALEQVESRYQGTYAQLLSVSRAESPNELALFERAVVPERPVPSRTTLTVGVAGAAGLGLAVGAILLMEYLDTSLRWADGNAQSLLGLPVLGAVPETSSKNPLAASDPLSPVAEGIRGIRTSLHLLRPHDSFRTLLFTSPGTSDGKSFIAANLATVLASAGERVVLVDADMRKPSLHEFFDRPNIFGLADILSYHRLGAEDDAATIPLQVTSVKNLYLLSSGQPPADPSSLLTSPRFASLLESLKKHGDIVLIDSPPALGPADAKILATHVQGTILVVSLGRTRRHLGQQARDRLLSQPDVQLLGVAVNRASGRDGYYYSYNTERGTRMLLGARDQARDDRRTISLAEAASRLGISQKQAKRWSQDGRLNARRRWLLWWEVDRKEVERVVEETLAEVLDGHDTAVQIPPSAAR